GIAVKKTTDPTYTTLSPRQPVSSTPYALHSLNAATADGLSVACINCITSIQIQSVNGGAVTGLIPEISVPDLSASYIKNATTPQASSNFNVSGTGTAGTFNAATQYNIAGSRALGVTGGNVSANGVGPVLNSNTFGGVEAGASVIPGAATAA